MNTKTETKENETIFSVSTETTNDLKAIGEYLKSKIGISLTSEQVIQHLIHNFKMMKPQEMVQQSVMYPQGVRCTPPTQSAGLSYEEALAQANSDSFSNNKISSLKSKE